MSTEKTSIPLDRLALTLTLAGVLLGISVSMVGRVYEQNFTMHGYSVFIAFSIAAIIRGAITPHFRKRKEGPDHILYISYWIDWHSLVGVLRRCEKSHWGTAARSSTLLLSFTN
jgi:hypothetical protein